MKYHGTRGIPGGKVSELVAPLTTAANLSTTADGDVESVTVNPKTEELALADASIVSNITEGRSPQRRYSSLV